MSRKTFCLSWGKACEFLGTWSLCMRSLGISGIRTRYPSIKFLMAFDVIVKILKSSTEIGDWNNAKIYTPINFLINKKDRQLALLFMLYYKFVTLPVRYRKMKNFNSKGSTLKCPRDPNFIFSVCVSDFSLASSLWERRSFLHCKKALMSITDDLSLSIKNMFLN